MGWEVLVASEEWEGFGKQEQVEEEEQIFQRKKEELTQRPQEDVEFAGLYNSLIPR